ncbi:MAG: DUF6232 family protein [Bacteroidota bacterium]
MTTGKVLYTDGHQVTITDSVFQVKGNRYRLDGIIRHTCLVLPPRRVPVLITIALGVVFMALGVFNSVPPQLISHLELGNLVVSARGLSLVFGAATLMAGIAFLIASKEKYSVHILTAEGEKAVVVSKQKEYIEMIGDALARALEKWRF